MRNRMAQMYHHANLQHICQPIKSARRCASACFNIVTSCSACRALKVRQDQALWSLCLAAGLCECSLESLHGRADGTEQVSDVAMATSCTHSAPSAIPPRLQSSTLDSAPVKYDKSCHTGCIKQAGESTMDRLWLMLYVQPCQHQQAGREVDAVGHRARRVTCPSPSEC